MSPPRILIINMVSTVGVSATSIIPYLVQYVVMILKVQLDLLKILKKFLPKFDPDKI